MIQNDEQLKQSRAAVTALEDSLRALRERVYEANPALFAAMARDYQENISAVRAEIDLYLGVAEIANYNIPLWMTLSGEAISGSEISSRLLAEWLGKLRKALYGVTTYLETGQIRFGGRPDATRLEVTDPKVLALSPGSIKIGVRLPEIDVQSDMFLTESDPKPTPYRALELLLAISAWADSDDSNVPFSVAHDTDELSLIARYAATLAPSERSTVQTVVFSGAFVPTEGNLQLNAQARTRLHGLTEILNKVSEEIVHGQVREIDLDAHRITLRERGEGMPDLKCFFQEDQMAVVEKLLDCHVTIRGQISSATPEIVRVLSIKEDEPYSD